MAKFSASFQILISRGLSIGPFWPISAGIGRICHYSRRPNTASVVETWISSTTVENPKKKNYFCEEKALFGKVFSIFFSGFLLRHAASAKRSSIKQVRNYSSAASYTLSLVYLAFWVKMEINYYHHVLPPPEKLLLGSKHIWWCFLEMRACALREERTSSYQESVGCTFVIKKLWLRKCGSPGWLAKKETDWAKNSMTTAQLIDAPLGPFWKSCAIFIPWWGTFVQLLLTFFLFR